jgi:hypothetical protein
MSQRPPPHRKARDPGFTLIEMVRPSDDRIAEAILYLLSRRLQRLAQAPACGEAPREELTDQEPPR